MSFDASFLFFDFFDFAFEIELVDLFVCDFFDSDFVIDFDFSASTFVIDSDFSDFVSMSDSMKKMNVELCESIIALARRDRFVMNTQFMHFERVDN